MDPSVSLERQVRAAGNGAMGEGTAGNGAMVVELRFGLVQWFRGRNGEFTVFHVEESRVECGLLYSVLLL